MRRHLTGLVTALAGAAAAAALAAPAAAANTGPVRQLPDSAEAWYATTPVVGCSAPVGCPPVAPADAQGYPANTLHAGVVGGQETARSYLEPDFTALPFGATLTAATLTVPVDTASNSGNQNVSSAQLVACLVTEPFPDGTDGSTAKPPAVDCSHPIKAVYRAAANEFTVNLAAYLPGWNSGLPELGVALLPATGESPAADWQVSFDGRKLAHAAHASTLVSFLPPSSGGTGQLSGPTSVPPLSTGLSAPQPVVPAGGLPPTTGTSSTLTGSAPATGSAPVVAAPTPGAAAPGAAPAALRGPGGFQYPEVLLLPLALLAGVVFAARLLTADATPRRLAR
jgi:hypothetical protein